MTGIETVVLAAIGKHLTGVAARYAGDAVQERFGQIKETNDLWKHKRKDEEMAKQALQEVMAEAARFQPTDALTFYLVPSATLENGAQSGIQVDDDELVIHLNCFNRADFQVSVLDIDAKATVVCAGEEFEDAIYATQIPYFSKREGSVPKRCHTFWHSHKKSPAID